MATKRSPLPSWQGLKASRPGPTRRASATKRFINRLAERTPDFQTKLGYAISGPGKANLTMSTNQLAERFGPSHGCVSMTLEMPFKDTDRRQ